MADGTGLRTVSRDTAEPDAPVKASSRSITGLVRSASPDGQKASPLSVLLILLVGGSGGVGIGEMLDGDDRVAVLERSVADHDRDIENHDKRLSELSTKTKDLEIKMHRESAATSRWVVEVLAKQSQALSAIANQLDVKVDLTLPPLVLSAEPTPVVESGPP